MPWHSLKEMKRYLLRSIHCSQYFNTLEPLKITPLNQYEFLIIPIVEYLKDKKVHFSIETKITNVVFKKENEKKKIIEIDLLKDEKDEKILV
jgi:oleate hydratase